MNKNATLCTTNVHQEPQTDSRWRLSNTLTATNAYELMEECIRVHGAETATELREGISNYIKFYRSNLFACQSKNYERPHQSLDNSTPASFYDKAA